MRRAAGRVFRALASGSPAQRAVDATLADWRHERAAASTPLQRLVINARSTAALIRTIALGGVAEFPQVLKGSLLARLAAATTALIAIAWLAGLSFVDDRFFLVASPLEVWGIAAASVAGQVAIAFPFVVFVAEAMGRRSRETRILGSLAVLVGFGLIMILLVLPSTMSFIAYERWWYFANSAQPAPALAAMWLSLPHIAVALISSTAVALLFLLANGIRRVGGLIGWSVGLGPALIVAASIVVLRLVGTSIDVRIGALAVAPFAVVIGLIWSAARLAGIAVQRAR